MAASFPKETEKDDADARCRLCPAAVIEDAGIHDCGAAHARARHRANAAIFMLVNSVLRKNLPVTDPKDTGAPGRRQQLRREL